MPKIIERRSQREQYRRVDELEDDAGAVILDFGQTTHSQACPTVIVACTVRPCLQHQCLTDRSIYQPPSQLAVQSAPNTCQLDATAFSERHFPPRTGIFRDREVGGLAGQFRGRCRGSFLPTAGKRGKCGSDVFRESSLFSIFSEKVGEEELKCFSNMESSSREFMSAPLPRLFLRQNKFRGPEVIIVSFFTGLLDY